MADAISIQELIDARTDAKTLEEAVNGDAVTTVLSRLGEAYPTLSNALNQIDGQISDANDMLVESVTTLFTNGGLPATPFKTKALMTASGLANDKYAMVTDDSVAVNNGLYIKTAGAWVKSAYNLVEQAKLESIELDNMVRADLTQAINVVDMKRDYTWIEEDQGVSTSEYMIYTGTVVNNTAFTLSDYIPVKKGECFVLTNLPDIANGTYINTFSLFDASKVFVGSIGSGRTTVNKESSRDDKIKLRVGVYSQEANLDKMSVVIPQDGFIKVCYRVQAGNVSKLIRTNFEGLIENSLIQAPKETMLSFKDKFFSVIYDKDVSMSGIALSQAKVGEPVIYQNFGNRVSKRYPVKKDEYVHLHSVTRNVGALSLIVEDESGNYLGVIHEFTATSMSGADEGIAYLNCKSNFSGFIRVQHSGQSNVPCMLAITSGKIDVEQQYIKSGQNIIFYDGSTSRPSVLGPNAIGGASWGQYCNVGSNADIVTSRSIPYLLKKGDVLEFSIEATIDPMMFLVLPNNLQAGSIPNSSLSLLPINAIEILDLETKGIAYLSDTEANKVFVGDAKKGMGAYCNEYEDSVVIFIRPRTASNYYSLHKCDKAYTVSTYTKNGYIEKRNSELDSRFKNLSKYSTDSNGSLLRASYTNSVYDTYGSYPAVLLFKGEVLNCLTGSKAVIKADRLRNIDEQSSSTIIGTSNCIYETSSLGGLSGLFHLPIKANDENSYNYSQVYAQDTCIVYLGFSALGEDKATMLDVDRLIRDGFFKPRIVPLSDVRVNDNVMPTLIRCLTAAFTGGETGFFSYAGSPHTDTYLSFVPANSFIEWGARVGQVSHRAVHVPIDTINSEPSVRNLPYNTNNYRYLKDDGEGDGLGYTVGIRDTQVVVGSEIVRDSLVVITSGTRTRDASLVTGELSDYSSSEANNVLPEVLDTDTPLNFAHKSILKNSSKHFLQSIPKHDFVSKYQVTSKEFIVIPDTNGIEFYFCEVVSSSLITGYWSILQIRRNGEVLAVVNALTNNQGQSSAALIRKSINIELYNDKGDEVYIKFGNNFPEHEMVLKSYLSTDKAHFKDTMSSSLWSDFRRVDPYPIGGAFPPEVFADTSEPKNQLAKGTTFGFPTSVYMGEGFYSLASLRNKKKRENYAMKKDDVNHILLQPDSSYNGLMQWDNLNINTFEVRNPKMSGYDDGDSTLPVAYVGVQDNIHRIFTWMQAVISGTVDIKTTYKDYIDLNSFIDYVLGINVMSHWDSQSNNFLLGTHDGKIWRTYWYDGDQTWGSIGGGTEVDPISIQLTGTSIFKTVSDSFPDEVKRRYRKLRARGVINTKKHQDDMRYLNSLISPEDKELDAKYWGGVPPAADIPYAMSWIYSRIRYLDIYYSYIDPDMSIVVQAVIDAGSIAANTDKTITYTGVPAEVGDLLKAELGRPLSGVDVSVAIPSNGTVVLTLSNTNNDNVVIKKGYLNITKEVQYD